VLAKAQSLTSPRRPRTSHKCAARGPTKNPQRLANVDMSTVMSPRTVTPAENAEHFQPTSRFPFRVTFLTMATTGRPLVAESISAASIKRPRPGGMPR